MLLAVVVGGLVGGVLTGGPMMAGARAEAPRTPDAPVRQILVTAGLTWTDVGPDVTPTLQCLADRSGVAAMSTATANPVSPRAEGIETLRTGFRGGAPDGPPTDRDPASPADMLSALPEAPQVIDLPSLPPRGAPGHDQALRAVDTALREALAPGGGCDAADLPRTMLVSVGTVDARARDLGQNPAQLQLMLDSGHRDTLLTSGSTHQSGVVALTDVLPTVLAASGASVPPCLPGQPILGSESADAQQRATDRTLAAGLVDRATLPALGSWMIPGALGLIVLLVPALARRRRLAAAARAALTIAPLCVPVGLCAGLAPWWRADHPVWALTGWVWAGSAILAGLALARPLRSSRFGAPGVVGALVAGIVLLESATGSQLQLGSPLGAQAISGGRYYGLSNHLFGAVLAGALLALLALFTVLTGRRARMLATVIVGMIVAGICVAPSMGADFGSMLVAVPVFGILALLVAGIRVRLWHLLALGAGGAALVMGISVLDWLRPPEQRSHLGRFIDAIASGELVAVIGRKLSQNIHMLLGIWPLAVVVAIALALTVAMLMPHRAHLHRLEALDAEHPVTYPVRITLAVGAWLGYAVNDTGPVLVAAALGVTLALLLPMLPVPVRRADMRSGANQN